MAEGIALRSFAAGELAPVLHSRADTVKYQTGLKTCRNWMVRREGGVSNRAGTKFVDPCKTDTAGTRLMRYVGSTPTDSMLIEMGAGYLRFFQAGASVDVASVPAWSAVTPYAVGDLVVSSGTNYYCILAHTNQGPPNTTYWYALTGDTYEIPTPYTDLANLPAWNQSGNVLTLTHQNYQPYELIFESRTRWILRPINTAPSISPPTTGLGSEKNAPGGLITNYKVTTAKVETYEESTPSVIISVINHTTLSTTAWNQIWWDAAANAAEYHVYADRTRNGVYGYIGTAKGTTHFFDCGQAVDYDVTPPLERTLFNVAGGYPAVSANFQQRRFFANTLDEPDAIYGSRIGFLSNYGISSPLQDDDALTFRLAGNNHHPIYHLAAVKSGLVLLTGGGEWTVTGSGGPQYPLMPTSISAEQETYVGVSPLVRPVVVGNAILYVQSRGSILRDLQFDQQVEGLAGRDLTIWATHLFDERQTIVAIDYQQNPHSIIWCVRSDGTLLALTYIPEQDIWGWHRHDTDGLFEDCCVVPEGDEDALYLLVSRTIGGATKRYIERLQRRDVREASFDADAFFVDCGLSYSGTPQDTFSGLDHLEGKVVAVLGDGEVVFDGDPTSPYASRFTVSSGTISLARFIGELGPGTNAPYSNVHIGLPIQYADLETLNLDVAGGTVIRNQQKRVSSVTVLLDRSSRSFYAGPDATNLTQYAKESWEGTEDLYTGQVSLNITTDWSEGGRVLIRQKDPLPITVLGIIPNVDLGG